MNSDISIVTMYFDIGRGDWSTEGKHATHLKRTNKNYFDYFRNLATLNNDMVIFTQPEFVEKIKTIRGNKPTKIITLDLEKKYSNCLKTIQNIQNNPEFLQNIPIEQRYNPEFWSAKYVLITNLKPFFVNQAIKNGCTQHNQVAWVDFGYCRTPDTLANIKTWQYKFDPNVIHFFSIKPTHYLPFIKNPKFPNTLEKAYQTIFNNKAFIIGGVTVGTMEKWACLLEKVSECQKRLIAENIVHAEQGVYVLCYVLNKDLFKIHFLGRNNWFGTFKKFHQ